MLTAALALVVLAAFTTEAVTGFGSMLVAVTFGALLFPLQEVVPIMVPLNLVLTAYMVWRYRKHVAGRLLLTRVLPLMGVGLVLGQFAFRALASSVLEVTLGLVVVALSTRELWVALRPAASASSRELPPVTGVLCLVGGGVMHGIYAMGGPLLVYVLDRASMEKVAFRSTLATVWLVLNAVLTAGYIATGRLTGPGLTRIAELVPIVIAAVFFGEWLHHRVDDRRFRIIVLLLLLGAGVSLAA